MIDTESTDEVNEEVVALKEEVLRAQAEVQNARRRAQQDVEKARKFALEKLCKTFCQSLTT